MMNNNIRYIHNNTFKFWPRAVYQIWLSSNNISEINDGAFENINFGILLLDHNRLRSFPRISKMIPIMSLNLMSNQITSVPRGVLANLTSLTQLYLENNRLSFIEAGAFEDLISLQILALAGNQLYKIPINLLWSCNSTVHMFWSIAYSKSNFNNNLPGGPLKCFPGHDFPSFSNHTRFHCDQCDPLSPRHVYTETDSYWECLSSLPPSQTPTRSPTRSPTTTPTTSSSIFTTIHSTTLAPTHAPTHDLRVSQECLPQVHELRERVRRTNFFVNQATRIDGFYGNCIHKHTAFTGYYGLDPRRIEYGLIFLSSAAIGDVITNDQDGSQVVLPLHDLNYTANLIARVHDDTDQKILASTVVTEYIIRVKQRGEFKYTPTENCHWANVVSEDIHQQGVFDGKTLRFDYGSVLFINGLNAEVLDGHCTDLANSFDNYATKPATGNPDITFNYYLLDHNGSILSQKGDEGSLWSIYTGEARLTLGFLDSQILMLNASSGSESATIASVAIDVRQPDPFGRNCGLGGTAIEDIDSKGVELKQNDRYMCLCSGNRRVAGSKGRIPLCEADKSKTDWPVLVSSGVLGAILFTSCTLVIAFYTHRRRRRMLRKRRLSRIASGVSPVDKIKLTASLFDALDSEFDSIAFELLSLGASANSRHNSTRKLPHAIVLGRDIPNDQLVLSLFQRHCVLDHDVGVLVQDLHKMAILQMVFTQLAKERWQCDESGDTALHRVVDACRCGALTSDQAALLAESILEVQADMLTTRNFSDKTPSDLCLACDGAISLKRMLTVVVYDSYQLLNPGKALYRSPTAIVMDCSDLTLPTDPLPIGKVLKVPLVLKMMTSSSCWYREIQCRQALALDNQSTIDVLVGIACDDSVPDQIGNLCISKVSSSVCSHQPIHTVASKLMNTYPFALLMEKADRNLFEIVSNERLTTQSLATIRVTATKLGERISELHANGIVHCDIKPRNVVRTNDRSMKLVDFDMAFASRTGTNQLGFHSTQTKVLNTSAYTSPELLKWACNVGSDSVFNNPSNAVKIDIWGFGATLFEILSGSPFGQHLYDQASTTLQNRILNWKGISAEEESCIRATHRGDQGIEAAIDIVRWMLEPDIEQRPNSMQQVLNHAFFRPDKGVMRLHFVLDRIKELLASGLPVDQRPCRKVMISYSWADTGFVLGKLCLALAPIVETMWVDRLGGKNGMGEWTRKSMQRGISQADIVIAVVSPDYVNSRSCGIEMEITAEEGKTIIPIVLGVSRWPPPKIGNTVMTTQFADSATGDEKIYIDFSKSDQFETKFHHDLKPRLLKDGHVIDFEGERAIVNETRLLNYSQPTCLSSHRADLYETRV